MRKYLYWEERRGDGKKLDEKNEEEEDGGYVKTTGLNKTRETDKQTNKQKQLLNAHAFFSTISPFYLFMHWGWQGSGSDEKIDCGTNCRFVPFVKCFRFQFSRFYCRRALKGLKQGKCSRSSQKLAQLSPWGEQGVFGWARRAAEAPKTCSASPLGRAGCFWLSEKSSKGPAEPSNSSSQHGRRKRRRQRKRAD